MENSDQGKAPANFTAAAEQQRLEKLSELERKARAEELANKSEEVLKAAEADRKARLVAKQAEEKRRQDEANARRTAEEAQRAEMKRLALERELSCVIKSTMTDAEISQCRWAWSTPRPNPNQD